jgi:hypothetical protein
MRLLPETLIIGVLVMAPLMAAQQQERRYLYVGVPGADDDIADAGAAGILVFDIDNGHRLVRRIAPRSADGARAGAGSGERVRGIAADVKMQRLYVSTVRGITALDLVTDRVLWEHTYPRAGAIGDVLLDGATIAPALGAPVARDRCGRRALHHDRRAGFPHQTLWSRDGRRVFLARGGRRSSQLPTSAPRDQEVGPFGSAVCPFTVNGAALAFPERPAASSVRVADLQTGVSRSRHCRRVKQRRESATSAENGIALATNVSCGWPTAS